MEFRCPICNDVVSFPKINSSGGNSRFFPFCSERCKLVDLGAWLDENYKIISGSQDDSSDSSEMGY